MGDPSATEVDEVVVLLRRISQQLEALPAAIAAAVERQRRPPRPLSSADANAFATLLPAIKVALKNETFSTRLLRDYATLNAPPFIALREALAAVGGSRKVGRLLLRGSQSDVPGFVIQAVGKQSEGRLWNLTEVVNMTIKTHKNSPRRVTRGPLKT
jgi:hypothetical protein